MPSALRHPSGRGPLLELCPEPRPKGAAKNRLHLDLRLETGDDPDAVLARVVELGGRELHPDWGDLPWRVLADPSGQRALPAPGPLDLSPPTTRSDLPLDLRRLGRSVHRRPERPGSHGIHTP